MGRAAARLPQGSGGDHRAVPPLPRRVGAPSRAESRRHSRLFGAATAPPYPRRPRLWRRVGSSFGSARPQWQRIVLVDLVHPWAIRRRAARLPQVAFATWDIAGVAATLLARPDHLPEPVPQWPLPADTDAVVSLNVMAQLPVVPLAWLAAHGVPDAACDVWAQQVVAAHWRQLARLGIPALLITDFAAEARPCHNRTLQRTPTQATPAEMVQSTLFGFALPHAPVRTWVWTIAPCGEVSPAWERRLHVGVFAP
ncbi:hypothetical protein [Hydrogenophilus thermoluteolus]|uniref:hypothetical protein n=1 Tax=Hydrogenophilus thermoluteolus TaxID=297 RepID=UPI003F667E14